MKKYRPLIIMPTYNEIDNIAKIIDQILNLPVKFEILVVDDNSPDKTGEVAKAIAKKNSRVFFLHREIKDGHGNAYKAGIRWARQQDFTHIISMDADFSHDPKYLPKLFELGQKYDVVTGSRYVPGGKIVGWQWFRYLNSWGANIFTRLLLGLKPRDITSGFKCYSRRFIDNLNLDQLISAGYSFQVEMIFYAQRGGFSIAETPIVFVDRRAGQSKISGELKKSAVIVLRLATRRRGLRQLIKFAIVGAVNTIIDWLVYWLIITVTGWNVQILKQLAKALSFTVSATSSYIMNRQWTFRSTNSNISREALKFFLVSSFGLVLNNLFFYIITGILGYRDIFGLIIATALVTFWNFFANRHWTFKEKT